ncbi:MAG: sigma-70 family RNA polymerase sigma factor, partial [Planctomycetota bacterium]
MTTQRPNPQESSSQPDVAVRLAEIQPKLYGFLRSIIYVAADADDLRQEVCEIVLRKAAQYDPERSFEAWVFGIARKEVLAFYKASQTKQPIRLSDEAVKMLADRSTLKESKATRCTLARLEECVEKLAAVDRRLLEMIYVDHCSGQKIAELVGWSEAKVSRMRSRIYSQTDGLHTAGREGGVMSEERNYSWAELVVLFQAMHDGVATPDEAQRLSTLLVRDERVRGFFTEYSQVRAGLELLHGGRQRHSLLADDGTDNEANAEMIACLGELLELEANAEAEIRHFDDTPVPDSPSETPAHHPLYGQANSPAPSTRVIVIPKLVFYGGIAALVMVCGLILSVYLPDRPAAETPRDTVDRATPLSEGTVVAARPNSYGLVIDSVGAAWSDISDADVNGHALEPIDGELYEDVPYSLQQGYARVQMEDGAVIIVQSPCDFVLEGPGKIRVHSGKVVCLCETESSKGLVVNTPSARIVDLGTEFGVQVDPDEGVHARVFQGVIALTSAKPADTPNDRPGSELILKSGKAVEVDTSGRIHKAPEQEVVFVRDAEYDIHRSIGDTPYARKLVYDRQVLLQMEGLELYYTFDGDSVQNSVVTNQADAASKRLAGRIVGDVRQVPG